MNNEGRIGAAIPNLGKYYRIVFVLLCLMVANNNVQAQQLSQDKMAAVMAVINLLLLDEDLKPIDIDVGVFNTDEYVIVDELLLGFEQQSGDLEICFVVEGDAPLAADSLTAGFNGQGSAQLITEGENCFTVSQASQSAINRFLLTENDDGITLTISNISVEPAQQSSLGLATQSRSAWDQRAVRKVLKIFAFGGHATGAQIVEWSNMPASLAITEMLNFDQHNLKLSPLAVGETYVESATQHGTFAEFANFISSDASNLPIPVGNSRAQFGIDSYNFDDGFNRMITVRGLNPFRQRIGFWETNYHLALNLDASVSRPQMATYYDLIMQAHEQGLPYHQVLGVAAKSAAAAMQYGHRKNRWNNNTGECECNDDFAREIHQLYYGIFGDGNPDHEDVTIPETAKMLTDMPVPYISGVGYALQVTFETDEHHVAPVSIFGTDNITGANASQKIDNLMPVSIQHPESLLNLPVMIISVLADDNLNEARKNQLRAAWAALGADKDFLRFIQTYAISELFHGPDQLKYLTSHERALYMANKNNLDNLEAYFGGSYYNGGRAGRTVGGVITEDVAGDFFRPSHNVFGGQTSFEASDSALAFEKNYNRLTDDEYQMRDAVQCDACDLGNPWLKKWPDVLPKRTDGEYYVSDVAQWLWNHAVGNMDNYTDLEKAQLYSLLGAARIETGSTGDGDHAFDFNFVMCVIADYQVAESAADAPIIDILTGNTWDDYCRENDNGGSYEAHELAEINAEYTGDQIANNPQIQAILSDLGNQILPFNAVGAQHANDGANLRKHARERVSSALGFIFTTPFIFAESQ